jgi:hypothetical protein
MKGGCDMVKETTGEAPWVVYANLEFFGLTAYRAIIMDEAWYDDEGRSDQPEEAPLAADPIVGFGLINSDGDWRVSDFLGRSSVSWRTPGASGGAFTSYDRHGSEASKPGRIPVRVVLRPTGLEEPPGIVLRQPHPQRSYIQEILEGPRVVELRPLIVDTDPLVLDPDALDAINLVLPPKAFALVAEAVRRGETGGHWYGRIKFVAEDVPVQAMETTGLDFHRGLEEDAKRLRLEWETALAWREAREQWEESLPKVKRWHNSEVHRALRQSLPALARRSIEEGWSEERRRDAFQAFLDHSLAWRLHHEPLPGATDAEGDSGYSGSSFRGSPRTTLGCRGIDPHSYALLEGPDVSYLDDLLTWERGKIPDESELLCRRIVHAYLTAETGDYLRRAVIDPARFGSVRAPYPLPPPSHVGVRYEYWSHPKAEAWRREQERYQRSRDRRIVTAGLSLWVVGLLVGSGPGLMAGTWLGAVVGGAAGLLVAGWIAGRVIDARWGSAVRKGEPDTRLANAMTRAVTVASQDAFAWEQLALEMRESAVLGAVWPARAWQIVKLWKQREASPGVPA